MPLFIQPPRSLCILRLSAVGDVCHALAAVQQIRRHWAGTHITWVIGKTEMALLDGIEGINFVPYDKKSGVPGVLAVWKTLKNHRFDALLNMQTAFRASVLSLGIHARDKIGFGQRRSREMQRLFVNRRIDDPQNPHVLDGFMAFVQYLGVPVSTPFSARVPLALSPADRDYAGQFLDPTRKNLVIAPCSSKAEKDWLPDRYAAVAKVAARHGINVIFCGSPAERERKMAEKITALCDFQPVNAVGKTTLKQLAALIAQADWLIAPDSGPAHIATTQGTPVIGLYAYHNPHRTAPYHDMANVISVYADNLAKEQGKPAEQLPWATKLKGKNLMAQIQVEQVVAKMREVGMF